MNEDLHIYQPRPARPAWQARRRPAATQPEGGTPVEKPKEQLESAARAARQRLWTADMDCYYAHQRYERTGNDNHRRIWQAREQESRAAADALREAEEALGGPAQPGV